MAKARNISLMETFICRSFLSHWSYLNRNDLIIRMNRHRVWYFTLVQTIVLLCRKLADIMLKNYQLTYCSSGNLIHLMIGYKQWKLLLFFWPLQFAGSVPDKNATAPPPHTHTDPRSSRLIFRKRSRDTQTGRQVWWIDKQHFRPQRMTGWRHLVFHITLPHLLDPEAVRGFSTKAFTKEDRGTSDLILPFDALYLFVWFRTPQSTRCEPVFYFTRGGVNLNR